MEDRPSQYRLGDASSAVPFGPVYRSTFMVLWGAFFPVVFLFLAASFERPDWQSGAFADYCLLLFYWPHLLGVYLLVAFSATGIIALAWRPKRAARKPWVRFAVVGGVGVWLAILVPWIGGMRGTFNPGAEVVTIFLGPFASAIVALPFAWVRHWALCLKRGEKETATGPFGFALLLLSLPFFGIWLFVLVPAAPLAVMTYGYGAYLCLSSIKPKNRRLSLKTLLLIVAWLSANFAAWRIAIDMMLAEYATLPTEPPEDCFIATAAARGHRRFVGTYAGQPVNQQLRRLKAAELILHHTTPRLHHVLRWLYNRLGPRAAKLLTNRWLADAAYVGLKPCEWLANVVLRIAGVQHDRIRDIYRP